MYKVNVMAVRLKEVVEVTVIGVLPSSCHKVEITDHSPGGNMVYALDPGEAQVFIRETGPPDHGLCSLVLVPWAETVRFKDKRHKKISVYSAEGKKLAETTIMNLKDNKGKKEEKPGNKFIVISQVEQPLPDETIPYLGCSILPEDAVYPMMYRQVFGPASHQSCQKFVTQHCEKPEEEKDNDSGCRSILRAEVNLKEQPNGLYVYGAITVFTEETTVSLTRAEPPEKDPHILLLNLTVTEHPGPMKGVDKPVFYTERGKHVGKYRQVQIVSNQGEHCTIDVRIGG
jgi:hypothetical protein